MVEIRTHWPNVGKCKQRDDKTDALRYKSILSRKKDAQNNLALGSWLLKARSEAKKKCRDSGRGV